MNRASKMVDAETLSSKLQVGRDSFCRLKLRLTTSILGLRILCH